MSVAYGKIILEPDKIYCLPLKGGHLDIRVNPDPSYPGLDVEFISDNEPENKLSRPRVLIEKPAYEDSDHCDELRALCWADRDKEDYTDEISLDSSYHKK